MKPLNKRLNIMTTLASLLDLRKKDLEEGTHGWPNQDYWNPMDKNPDPLLERNRQRAMLWPTFSVHGSNTQINLKIHRSQDIIGALRLFDPRNDQDVDNYYVLPKGIAQAELFDAAYGWSKDLQTCPHAKLSNPLRFWAALDIVFMMSLQGFEVKVWGYDDKHVFVNGVLLPRADESYGRFALHLAVVGDQHHTPKDREGNVLSVPEMYDSLDTYVKHPEGLKQFHEQTYRKNLSKRKLYYQNGLHEPDANTDGVVYAEACVHELDLPAYAARVRELTVKAMGLPAELVSAGPTSFSIRTETIPMSTTDQPTGDGQKSIAAEGVTHHFGKERVFDPNNPNHHRVAIDPGVAIMIGDRIITQAELEAMAAEAPEDDTDDGDDTPLDYSILSDSDRFIRHPAEWPGAYEETPLPNGTDELTFLAVCSHRPKPEGERVTIDKRDAAGNVMGHEEVPRKQLLADDDDPAGAPRSE